MNLNLHPYCNHMFYFWYSHNAYCVCLSVGDRNESDPFKDEPETSPVLIYRQRKPTNAEPPVNLLAESYLTPNGLWFIRGHHPVPLVRILLIIAL